VDVCDINETYIIQNRTNGSGKCNLFLDKHFSLAKQTIAYRAFNKDENTTKYIYYYLLSNKEIIEKGFLGANHKNISKEYVRNIRISIPSLSRQKEIVAYCEYNDMCIKKMEQEMENNKKQAHECMVGALKRKMEFCFESV
jgi:restriction endonuclease S subunit